jgi:hypothetical protein
VSPRPETVKVGPLLYWVQWDSDLVKARSEGRTGPDEEWAAFSDHERLVIGINPGHGPGAQRQSLLHEVLHCCLRMAGCWPDQYATVWVKAREVGPGPEEMTVSALAAPMVQVLGENPHLLAWLRDDG